MLGAQPWAARAAHHFAVGAARDCRGSALALLETLNDIGASEYLGVQTLTLSIFTTWLNRGSLAGAAQMACLMLLIVAALIALERYGRRAGFRAFRHRTSGPPPGSRWRARRDGSLPSSASSRSLLGFLLPAGYLLREVVGARTADRVSTATSSATR